MFGRGKSRVPEDPSVAPVEAILDRVATRASAPGPGSRRPAKHALWICACMTTDDMDDAPTWPIYDEPEGALRWCRIPDGSEADDIVNARFTAGGHADPGGVLAWLKGDETAPWAGADGWGDPIVISELGRKVLSR